MVPLIWIVEWVLGRRDEALLSQAVGISFDHGADFDYYDIVHPEHGRQRSFYNLLSDFRRQFGEGLHASAFVIASALARQRIAAGSYAGRQ